MSVSTDLMAAPDAEDLAVYQRALEMASNSPLGVDGMMSRHGYHYWMNKAAEEIQAKRSAVKATVPA